MTLDEFEWLSKIFNYTKRRAASLYKVIFHKILRLVGRLGSGVRVSASLKLFVLTASWMS